MYMLCMCNIDDFFLYHSDNPLTNTTEQINDGTTGPTEGIGLFCVFMRVTIYTISDTSILANGDKIAITSLVTSIVFPILLFVASTILNVKGMYRQFNAGENLLNPCVNNYSESVAS